MNPSYNRFSILIIMFDKSNKNFKILGYRLIYLKIKTNSPNTPLINKYKSHGHFLFECNFLEADSKKKMISKKIKALNFFIISDFKSNF